MANHTMKVSNRSGALISDPTNVPVITSSASVKSVETGKGLTGGPITSAGTIEVLANTGIYANSSGLFVNSAYISTLAVNSAIYLGSANLQNIQTFITSNAGAAYSNAVSYVDGKAYVNNSVNVTFTGIHIYSSNVTLNAGLIANGSIGTTDQILKSNGANVYWSDAGAGSGSVTQINTANGLSGGPITTSGTIRIVANSGMYVNSSGVFVNAEYISTLASNTASFLGNSSGTIANVSSWITTNAASAYTNAVSYVDGKAYVNTSQLSSNLANYQTTAGLASNVATLSANSSTFLGAANLQNIQTFITANASSAYTNAVSYVDGKAYVNTSQLSSNLTNYQTNAGLAANVATLTSNNASFAYGKNEINLNVNNALTANSSTFLETANLQNIQTFITSNAGAAYSNAVAYIDGKSYVNTSQLSSNLANYQTSAGLAANVAVLASNSASFLGNSTGTIVNISSWITTNAASAYTNAVAYVDGKSYVNTSQLSGNLANYQTTAGLAANVAALTSNNSTFAYSKTEINLNVNNALTANSSTYLGSANLSNIQTYITSNASAAYSNAVSYVDGKAYVNTSQLSSNLANYQTASGLASNVAVLAANSASFLGNSTGTISNISSWITSNSATAYTNAVSYVDGKAYVNTSQLSSNLASYQNTTGLAANVATLTANNTSFVGSISAANVVSNAQLSSNLASYQTSAGLSANVATLAANSSTYLGTANLNNIQTFITSNASAAYTNAVAYVDGKSYVNTAQLSSNLASYQTTAGLSANVATLAANSSTFLGTSNLSNIQTFITSNASAAYTNAVSYVDGKSYVNTSQLSSNLASYQTTAGLAANVAALTANNATNLGGVPAASYVNTSGSYTITGVHTYSNGIAFSNTITANGSNGTAGQVLTSSGDTGNAYWSTFSGGGGGGFTNGQSITVNNFTVTGAFTANSSNGSSGQVLTSNGTAVYWSTMTGAGTVTSVATGNGMTGGPITSAGAVSVLANTGIVANESGLYVNSAYIATITANNANNLNEQPASFYTNATNITTGTLPWAQAPINSVNTTGTFTFSGLQTFNGNSSALSSIFVNAAETTTVSAIAANGTINYDLTTQSVLYYTTNAAANWTVNFRGSSGTTLNNTLSNNQTITAAFLVSQGATAYFANNTKIDGANVSPKWQGGTAPTAGNISGIDIYTYTIIKTGTSTFTVLASQTQFK